MGESSSAGCAASQLCTFESIGEHVTLSAFMPSSAFALLTNLACTGTLLLGAIACGGDSNSGAEDAAAADSGPVADAAVEREASVCQSEPGTRLTREYIEPSAGARQEFDILDSELGEGCRFSIEGDGSYTCYPSDFETLVLFQDAACTSAIVGVTQGTTPKEFARARRLAPGGCYLRQYYRRIGMPSAVATGQSVFRQDTSGTCSSLTAPARDYFLAGSELPISSFVTASREADDDTARIASPVFVGSDGSRMCDFETGFLDSELDVSCAVGSALDSELFCFPAARAPLQVFSNASCSEEQETIRVDRCEDVVPEYAVTTEAIECGAVGTSIVRVGDVALEPAYEDDSGSCLADTSGDRYFPTSEAVANSEFAALTTRVEDSGERLSHVVTGDSEEFLSFAGLWYDATLDTRCTFASAIDGSFRCLPESISLATFYRDDICTESIALAHVEDCQEGKKHLLQNAAMGRRVLATEVFEGPLYERTDGGAGCAPISGTFLQPSFELAPSSFVLGTVAEL